MPALAVQRRWKQIIFAATLMMPIASMAMAPDGSAKASDNPYGSWAAQAASTLSHRPDADALVTAAMLRYGPTITPNRETLQLLDQAGRLEPAAADIAALAMLECEQVDGCDTNKHALHLQALAPDNALALLPSLRTARKQQDVQMVSQVLQSMAQAGNFETYQIPLTKRIQDSLEDLPPTPGMGTRNHLNDDHARALQTFFLVSLLPMPNYQDLVQACEPDNSEFARRQPACQQIALELTQSWSMVANAIGFMLQRWTARNAQNYQQALAQERDLDWLMSIRSSCDQAHVFICVDAETKATSELDASRAIARLLDKPVTPPDNWVDQRQQSSIRRDQQRFHLSDGTPGERTHGKTAIGVTDDRIREPQS